MTLVPKSELRPVTSIDANQQRRISDFLHGAVYSWCKNNPGQWFALRDLMGGGNFFWQGTPLVDLYIASYKGHATDAIKAAGQDAGWLLKSVIAKDKRDFETKIESQVRHYRWTGSEDGI